MDAATINQAFFCFTYIDFFRIFLYFYIFDLINIFGGNPEINRLKSSVISSEIKTITLIECANGKFGQDCNERCGECVEEQCHHVNGSCVNGCKPGYKGIKCTKGSQCLLY